MFCRKFVLTLLYIYAIILLRKGGEVVTLKEMIEFERSISGETQNEFCKRAKIGTNTLAKINRGKTVHPQVQNRVIRACMRSDGNLRKEFDNG